MLTARTHRLSLFVHAVDDLGAICGTRPSARGWLPNTRWPVSCPTCLVRMTIPRYVFCGVPSGTAEKGVRHIRLVGVEGVQKKGGPFSVQTLCSLAAGWDYELVGKTPLPGDKALCADCVRELRRKRTGLTVSA